MGLFDFLFGKKRKKEKEVIRISAPDRYYSWQLMRAAVDNTDSVLELKNLLELGADVNYRDCSDCTPLMKAMKSVYAYQKAKLLLKYGADVNVQNYFGKTVLGYALDHGPDMVRLVLNHQADIDHKDYYGMTALMWAIQKKYISDVLVLLAYGADVSLQNEQGQTALMLAAEGVDREYLVRLLLKYHSPIDTQDKKGETALMKAILTHNKRIMKVLLENGAQIDLQDKKGRTALSLAKEQGEEEMITVLSEYQKKQSEKQASQTLYNSFKVTRHQNKRSDLTGGNQNMKH